LEGVIVESILVLDRYDFMGLADKGDYVVSRSRNLLFLVSITLFMLATCSQGVARSDVGYDQDMQANQSCPLCYCRATVGAFTNLTRDLEFPPHLGSRDATKIGTEFDVNRYFSVLDHLSMQPGYILDWVYYYEFIGGEPVIYARKSDQPAYRTYSEYAQENGVNSLFQDRNRYLEHVQIDGTPESFFQYVLLYLMGGQFYLFWHANYNDQKVICDRSEAETILEELKRRSQSPSANEIEIGLRKEISPQVDIKGDVARVKVVVFTNWGGFIQKTFNITRTFPHTMNESSEVLIPYDCGISF
jgi:hypothetical protein